MSTGAIVAIAIVAVVVLLAVILIVWIIATYNKFVKMRNNVDEAYSTMDVYMKKRYDLIPNLVETVKGYATHEEKTLEGVMAARYSCMNANNPQEKAEAENMLTGTLKSLFAVSENYPNLKADQNFMDLQQSLKTLEEEIATSRKYYNGCVKTYNVKRETFPSNIIAKWFKFEKRILFEIANEEERNAPKVQF